MDTTTERDIASIIMSFATGHLILSKAQFDLGKGTCISL